MRRRVLAIGFCVTACGADGVVDGPDAPTPDAPTHWTWSFEDPQTGQVTECPAGVTEVEITSYDAIPHPGDGCGTTRYVGQDRKRVPCSVGEVDITPGHIRFDVLMDDGRLYARFDPWSEPNHHVRVLTRRGFVRVAWSIYDTYLMQTRGCTINEVLDASWVGPTDFIPCTSPTFVLPGQPEGTATVELVLRSSTEGCFTRDRQTFMPVIQADTTIDLSVQFQAK